MKDETIRNFIEEITNAVNDGMMVVDTNGIIRLVNHSLESITGFSRKELTGASCEILNCDVCDMSRSESKDKWCMLFEVGHVSHKRCLIMKKDGGYVSVFKSASVLRDPSGQAVGALETFVDI